MNDPLTPVLAWFDALRAGDWPALLAAYAPDALVLAGPQVLPRHAVDPAAFARVMAAVAAAQAPAAMQASVGRIGALPGGDMVVSLTVRSGQGTALPVGVLVGPAGIRAMAVAPAAPDRVAAEAAVVLAHLPPPERWDQAFLTTLHHAWAHHHGLPLPVRTLPEARFTCQGFGECCQVGAWKIEISDNQRLAAAALSESAGLAPLTFVGAVGPTRMGDPAALESRHRLAGSADGGCAQLNGDRGCSLHAVTGWQPLPPCQLYPVRAMRTPDGYDVTTVFHCEAVCRNLGAPLSEQGADLQRRIWPFQFRVATVSDEVRSRRDGVGRLSWVDYRQIETTLLDWLDAVRHEGSAALLKGSDWLAERLGLAGHDAGVTVADLFKPLVREAAPEPPGDSWLGGGSRSAWAMAAGAVSPGDLADEMIVRYLRTVFFRKEGLNGGGAALPWATVLVAARMIALDAAYRARHGGRPHPNAEDAFEAVRATEAILAQGPYVLWLSVQPGAPHEAPGLWRELVTGG